MIKKVITNLHLSNADCIPVVVLKNCEPELSEIQADLFKESEGVLSEGILFSGLLRGLISGPCI